MAVSEKLRIGIIAGGGIQGGDQAINQKRHRQSGQNPRQSLTAMPSASGSRAGYFPARRDVTFGVADEEFCQQQKAQRKARIIHRPDRPILGRAKDPRTENHHRQDQHPAQVFTNPVELHIRRPQPEEMAACFSRLAVRPAWR